MGALGAGLYSDDDACDARERFLDLLGEGHSGPVSTEKVLAEWEGVSQESTGFWLALAETQWRVGRLEDHVKAKALEIIDTNMDLDNWSEDGPKSMKARKSMLDKLRAKLLSPQPPAKKIRRRFKDKCDWPKGEVVSYRLRSGKLVLFRLIGVLCCDGSESPVFEFLNWVGEKVPAVESLMGLEAKAPGKFPWNPIGQFAITRTRESDFPTDRVQRIGVVLEPSRRPLGPEFYCWKRLDAHLKEDFGLE